jgi:hypothetical protein
VTATLKSLVATISYARFHQKLKNKEDGFASHHVPVEQEREKKKAIISENKRRHQAQPPAPPPPPPA